MVTFRISGVRTRAEAIETARSLTTHRMVVKVTKHGRDVYLVTLV